MTGLTNEEVQERIAQGQVNNNENPNTRTYKQIILENTLTFFNFLNLVLAGSRTEWLVPTKLHVCRNHFY